MNVAFTEYVTSGAYCMTLSSNMISVLEECYRSYREQEHRGDAHPEAVAYHKFEACSSTMMSLRRRGLLTFVQEESEEHKGFKQWKAYYVITRAGLLQMQMLEEAGLIHGKAQ